MNLLIAFFLKGIAVGVIIAVPVGPVGVLCIRRTIFDGRLAGLLSGFGAATADALFGVVAAFGLTVVSNVLLDYQTWLRLAGGAFLLYIGGGALLAQPRVEPAPQHRDPLLRDFASTFLLTLTNPITVFVFLGVFAALGLSGPEATLSRAGAMVLGVLTGSLLWWAVLIFGTGMFLHQLDQRHMAWINRGSGAILFLSGAALVATVAARRLGLT